MAIFPVLELEAIVQVADRTRLSGVKTYASKDGPDIDKVEIEPYSGAGFIEVTGLKSSDWFTDYQYDSDGDKTVTIKINGDTTPVLFTQDILVISEADDMLFASDSDLVAEENDILKFVQKGRNTFKDVHREAQTQILQFIDDKGFVNTDGTKISKEQVLDKSEVREWAKDLALELIFNAQSNQVGDIFDQKSKDYHSKVLHSRQKNVFRLDLNKDDILEPGEGIKITTSYITRA